MERIKRHKIKILCGLLYTFCLFNLLGISMHTGQNENKPAKESKEEEAVPDAVEYVSSSMVAEAPKIAITFDDGPSAHCTGRLLDGLKERNVKATFFLIGKNTKENP